MGGLGNFFPRVVVDKKSGKNVVNLDVLSADNSTASKIDRAYFPRAPLVKTVTELVDAVLKVLDHDNEVLGQLSIRVHGSPGAFYLDDGNFVGKYRMTVVDSQGERTSTAWAGVAQFARLKGRFAEGGRVLVLGCNSGADARLLQKMSEAMGGVPVRAGLYTQYSGEGGVVGEWTECQNKSCTVGGSWNLLQWLAGDMTIPRVFR